MMPAILTLMSLIVCAALALALYQLEIDKHPEQLGDYALFAGATDGSTDVLRPEHYDDQRNGSRLGTAPYVQSQVISDPYLRLVIPIDPQRQNDAIRRNCPLAAGRIDRAQQRALLDCIGKLHPLTLDGNPVADLHFDPGSDAKSHRPALVAMIDVRGLANGRHELLVGEPAPPDPSADTQERISFWR